MTQIDARESMYLFCVDPAVSVTWSGFTMNSVILGNASYHLSTVNYVLYIF